MNIKLALSQNPYGVYSPSNYENIIRHTFTSCNCQYSLCNIDCDCNCHFQNKNYYHKNDKTIEKHFNSINDYHKTRILNEFNNINSISYLNNQINNKKVEYSKSLDKKLTSNEIQLNFEYDNKNRIDNSKSFDKINKEISQFKDKMNKDKEYLNNIKNQLFNHSDMSAQTPIRESYVNENNITNENYKNKKRSVSLSYRTQNYKSSSNVNQNLNINLNDYYTQKRRLRNAVINTNSFIDNYILSKQNSNEFNDDTKNNFSYNYNNTINDYHRRHNSFLSISKNKNKVINNFIHNNNIFDNIKLKYPKEYLSDNKSKNLNKYEYMGYNGRKNIEKRQNDYSNMKYLTIQTKNDKIQLKEKEIKLNNNINKHMTEKEINNYTDPNYISINNERDKNKKDLIKYQIKKYNTLIDDMTYEKRFDNNKNNNKRKKLSLNNILSNYEIIKTKYDKSKNNFNSLSDLIINKNLTKVKSEIFTKNDINEDNNIKKVNQNDNVKDNDNNKKTSYIMLNNFIEDKLKKINIKNYEDLEKTKANSKSSNHNKEPNTSDTKNNSFNKNCFKTVSSFSLNIDKNEDKDKDLLIKNLKDKIIELENQLNIANSKLKDFSKIFEQIKNKNKKLYIDKITSFNYITIQNHIIRLNKGNFNINIKRKNKNPKLNNNDELIIHFPQRSTLGKSPPKFINTTSDNEQFSYSSFDNYKNMNIYFRKITTTVHDQKIYKSKPLSLTKNPIKYKNNILLHKLNITKDVTNSNSKIINIINNNFIKDLKLNEKIIYIIYPYDDNINALIFEPILKKFSIQKIIDNANFSKNYTNNINPNKNINYVNYNNGNIFLYNEGYLYIVTGKNYNMFYKFDPYKKEINNLCKLKYNHSNGNLIFYDQRIFCLSGDFNKKVECFIESKNEWIEIPEMLSERSFFSSCIIKEQYLFVFFGYNNISKQYLNSIEFIDLLCENAKWKYLYFENNDNLSLFLIGTLGINYDNKKIIIFGGYDDKIKKGNNCFYQLNLKKNFDEENYEINDEKLSNIITINKGMEFNNNNNCYFFNYGFNKYYDENNNLNITAFDSHFHAHIINLNNFSQEIFNYE